VPSASVVIAAFSSERLEALREAVASVAAQTVPALETIVVVDHNPALLAELRAAPDGAVVLENTFPHGASGARNTGVAASRGDVVAFIDDDVTASPRWLEELLVAYRGLEVMGVGGRIDPDWLTGRPGWFPPEFDWVVGCTYTGMPAQTTPQRNLIAANMSIRRDAFEALGGFRTDFGKQGTRSEPEETELCIRALRRWPDRVWLYEPRAGVRHKVPAARARWRYFVERCFNEGIGKARLASYSSRTEALSTERRYVRSVLPRAVARGLSESARGDRDGARRAAAVVAGLAITACGYLRGRAVRDS
jgi:glycosyltransferase involved in cell wall biosynthesis